MTQPQGNRNGVHGADGATFEQCFGRLQEVVQKLSAGNLTLQEALGAFEEGMSLADKCQGMLDQAELRIKQVSAKAARSGAEAVARMEAAAYDPSASGQIEAIEIQTLEQRVVIDPASPAAPPPGGPVYGKPAWEARTPGTPQAPRPGAGVPPRSTRATGAAEDPYADKLDLGPLFDDED